MITQFKCKKCNETKVEVWLANARDGKRMDQYICEDCWDEPDEEPPEFKGFVFGGGLILNDKWISAWGGGEA